MRVRLRFDYGPWPESDRQTDWLDLAWAHNFYEIFQDQQEKLGLIDTDGKGDDDLDNDGSFWMSWDDFCEEFEQLTVCHLDDPQDMEKRVIGTFSYNGK